MPLNGLDGHGLPVYSCEAREVEGGQSCGLQAMAGGRIDPVNREVTLWLGSPVDLCAANTIGYYQELRREGA